MTPVKRIVKQFGKGSEPNARLLRRRNATLRAARPDPSLRNERLLGMTIKTIGMTSKANIA
jgi:hypothetical protein